MVKGIILLDIKNKHMLGKKTISSDYLHNKFPRKRPGIFISLGSRPVRLLSNTSVNVIMAYRLSWWLVVGKHTEYVM